jgi:hypothetical protein
MLRSRASRGLLSPPVPLLWPFESRDFDPYPSSVVVRFRLILRREEAIGVSGIGGDEPYMYDWIMIVMSNRSVPPDPRRYLWISVLRPIAREGRGLTARLRGGNVPHRKD